MNRLSLLWTLFFVMACGRHPGPKTKSDLDVIGGRATLDNAFQEVVALMQDDLTLCTGTLISTNLVLTAAHCVEELALSSEPSLEDFRIVSGGKSVGSSVHTSAKVLGVKIHPRFWSDHRGAFDFALLAIDQAWTERHVATFYEAVMPRNRVELQQIIDQTAQGVVVGYGLSDLSTNQTGTDIIGVKHAANIPLNYSSGIEIFAGGDGVDTCSGDSGGPLFVRVPKSARFPLGRILVGVTSRGPVPCGSQIGFGTYGLSTEAACWIRSQSNWAKGDAVLADFCVRDIAAGTVSEPNPLLLKRSLTESCMDERLDPASKQDLGTLLDFAGVARNVRGTRESCEKLETFLTTVTTLNLAGRHFRQVAWLSQSQKLKTLNLRDNMIVDASPLLGLKKLQMVDLRNNALNDLSTLEALQNKQLSVFGFRTQRMNLLQTRYLSLAEKGASLPAEERALIVALRPQLAGGNLKRKSLDLSLRRHLNLDHQGVRSLEALRGLENLEVLSLLENSDLSNFDVLLTLPGLLHLRVSKDSELPEEIKNTLLQRRVKIEFVP